MEFMKTVHLIRARLARHSIREHLTGLWFSRHFTEHGIVVVTGGRPRPEVFNRGGELRCGNCQFYSGVRLEIGPGAGIEIGNGTYINRNTLIVAEESVRIGRDCRISWDVIIMDSDQHPLHSDETGRGRVTIGDNVWIGCRSIILKGVTIGEGAVVAAGSVVTKDLPAHTIAAGVPARVLPERRN